MKIKVNGDKIEIDRGTTLLSLLVLKGVNPSLVVVEYNYDIPEREKWGDLLIKEDDNIEIVKFMGGG